MSYLDRVREIEANLRPAVPQALDPAEGDEFRALRESLLAMTLGEFEAAGSTVYVSINSGNEALWIVPKATDAADLVGEGIRRGSIWTAGELREFFTIPGLSRKEAMTIIGVKSEFDGIVVGVRHPKGKSPPK